ncbi:MAG: RHS repeat-associated core domain-containing protein [Dehalococcoidia bacterium]
MPACSCFFQEATWDRRFLRPWLGISAQPRGGDDGRYVELQANLYSDDFELTDKRIEFDYDPVTNGNNLTVQLYRASNGALLDTEGFAGNAGWKTAVWKLNQSLVGETVYLRFYATSRVRIDDIGHNLYEAINGPTDKSHDTGDPFDTATGQFSHGHTDISVPGKGIPLGFTRSYRSMFPNPGDLGFGWRHTYSSSLRIDSDNSVTVYYSTGGAAYFEYSGGSYTQPDGIHDGLVKNGDGTYTMTAVRQIEYNFSSAGKLTSIIDRDGNTTTVSYDGNGYISEVEDAGGRTLTFTPDASGRIVEIEDPLGRTVGFEYDASGDLVEVTDVKGGTTAYTYNNHRMASLTDSNGHLQNENIYDGANRVVEQEDATGGITCAYYGSGPSYTSANCTGISPAPGDGQTVVVNPRGYKTTYDFDTKFRTTSITDHNGGVTSFGYDSDNNRTCITDPLGNRTGLDYDADGNVIEMIDAGNTDSNCVLASGGVSLAFTYTASNDLETVTDPLGRETENIYDADGNLARIVRMDDASNTLLLTCFEYANGDGLVTAIVESTDLQLPADADDPCTGNETELEYDSYGNAVAFSDPRFSGQATPPQTILDPDIVGRVESVTDELSHSTTVSFDNFNMPLSVTDELGNRITWTYDPKGNVESVTDANRQAVSAPESGASCGSAGTGDGDDDDSDTVVDDGCPNTIYTYDNADRLTEVIDALGQSTAYAYDSNGNLMSVTNGNRQAVSAAESGASCGATGTGDGDDDDSDTIADDGCPSTVYSYDELDRLISTIDALGREATYDYDDASNLRERVDSRGLITEYTPDELNRLDLIEYWDETHANMTGSVNYDYDDVGNRIEMVDSTGTTTYLPDPLNRLESATFPGSVTVSYEYDEVGDRTKITYPSTDEVDYTYDEGHRMETVTDWLSNQTSYTYDDAGRLDLAELPNGVETDYVYDIANRLTDLTNTGPGPTTIADYHYELDAAGNRTEMTDLAGTHEYVYDALYRLTEVTYPDPETDAYTYDPNGNRLTKDSDDYTYDAADQLLDLESVSFEYDNNGNQIEKGADTFSYDHENRLIEAVTGADTSTSEYNGDGMRMSLTVDDGSPTTTDYVWDVNRPLPVILDDGTNQYVYGLSLIAAVDGSDSETYFVYDGLGSVTALTDDAGATTDTYTYDVFGEVRSHIGSSPNYWQFTGEQSDADSRLQYLRARFYDQATGRFVGRDPLTIGNRYSYVMNNPVNLVDPSGLCPLFDCPFVDDEIDWLIEASSCAQDWQCLATEAIGLIPACDAFSLGNTVSCQLLGTCAVNLLYECGVVLWARSRAGDETESRFPGGAPDRSPGNRFLHCYWSGLIALVLGADRAELYTTRYEATEDNTSYQKDFDLRSNELGRRFGEQVRPSFGPFNDLTKYDEAASELSDLCYAARSKE